jgi:putative ABC transport system ATP-binding protein
MTKHVDVRGVGKSHGSQPPILRDVDLSIARGERVALLGRSGSGKSTLLNLIAGIDQLDRGQIEIDGVTLSSLPDRERTLFRRRHIGFVYQTFNLIDTLSAIENIQLPLQLNRVPAAECAERAADMLQRIGLAGRASAFPDQLSGGEQQRVAIARAMVHEPALVLADEHTGNLDATTGDSIAVLFGEMADALNQSVLMVTHSRSVAQTADRVLTLRDGSLVPGGDDFAW